MRWQPESYQKKACNFLWKQSSGLFLDPGMGKTAISLYVIKNLKQHQHACGVLMIAPIRVMYSVWQQEIDKWDDFNALSMTRLHGATKSTLWDKHDIYVINPEGLPWLKDELLNGLSDGKSLPFDVLWIDESTKFKNPSSKRFKILATMLPLFKRRHIMTGTPAPRGYINLWSQIFLLDNGLSLGSSFYKFRNRYFFNLAWNKYSWILKNGSEKDIQKTISPLILDLGDKTTFKLPDLIYNDIKIKLDKKSLSYYKRMENDLFISLDDSSVSAENVTQIQIKCQQIANGRVYEDEKINKKREYITIHDCKIEALKELIDELNEKPLLIAYHFKHDLEALKDNFKNLVFIDGNVKPEEVEDIRVKWNNGDIQLLAAQNASLAHGLNFQDGGNDVVWFSMVWDLENYLQFNKRIHRRGVNGAVRIHHLIADDTIDQMMLDRCRSKDKRQTNLREALREHKKDRQ